jgi:mannose-6-phosphate isomerase-like protein (cupin superfamily)
LVDSAGLLASAIDAVHSVHENESTYIPIGAIHCSANPGKILLELIEGSEGSYLSGKQHHSHRGRLDNDRGAIT